MIKLEVDKYCDNCPEFESHVIKNTIYCNSTTITNTIIECEHRERCRSIKKFLENKENKND